MPTEKYEKNEQDVSNSDASVKPDPETLHTTDPQEHMDGPISSLVKGLGNKMDEKGGEKEDNE